MEKMIYYSIPYSTDKNIGKYYNDVVESVPNDTDFVCFVDGDTIFNTSNFGSQIHEATLRYPECRFFTGLTNRVNFQPQVYEGVDKDSNDIAYHRNIGKQLQDRYWDECEDYSHFSELELLSGFLMLIRKDLWRELGGFKEGLLGVDNDIHLKCIRKKEKVYLMKGVYLYHWYRWPNYKDKSHLI